MANKTGTSQFFYADFTTAPTTWIAINVFTSEASPDNLISLYVNKRTIILGGTLSTEFWFNDGITPFSRIQGTTTARGLIAPYSSVIVNETVYFLDDKRRLVRLDGTSPVILSTSFDKTIKNFSIVNDLLMDYITVDGRNFVILSFPTEDRTLVYDLQSDTWCEWDFWDSSINSTRRFIGNCYTYARAWNKHIFGRINNSQIYEMSSSTFADEGVDIHFKKITGNIDHGVPNKRKTSYSLTLLLKTGVGLGQGGNNLPYLLVRWKDDNKTGWSNYRYVSLKVQGDRKATVKIHNLGSYYTRKWEFKVTDQIPFTMSRAYEEIDVREF